MKYRDHRGSLADSMKTLVELPATRKALIAHLATTWPFSQSLSGLDAKRLEDVTVERYFEDGDDRIGWKEVWIVVLSDFGVLGFTDGGLTLDRK
jgi:hypothetical protein